MNYDHRVKWHLRFALASRQLHPTTLASSDICDPMIYIKMTVTSKTSARHSSAIVWCHTRLDTVTWHSDF